MNESPKLGTLAHRIKAREAMTLKQTQEAIILCSFFEKPVPQNVLFNALHYLGVEYEQAITDGITDVEAIRSGED